MKIQITKRIARRIFAYYELEGLQNIIMISNRSKRITFDNFFYRDEPFNVVVDGASPDITIEPLYIVVKKFQKENEITFIYNGVELTVDECFLVYKDREEKIPLDTMRFYFIEEIINDIADKNNFGWEYK